jgi:hypothetical protein
MDRVGEGQDLLGGTMPNMFGGDQLDEDYAPTAYVNHVFVGLDETDSFEFRGKYYHFSTDRRKNILIEVDGEKRTINDIPKSVAKKIRAAQGKH